MCFEAATAAQPVDHAATDAEAQEALARGDVMASTQLGGQY